jgi:DNA-directed RNA polymerase subunit RPC12/RpoP
MSYNKLYCQDCGKQLGNKAQYNGTKRCLQCNGKYLSITYRGSKTSNFKDGRSLKKYYCIDCGKEISDYRHKRCLSCSDIYLHKIGKLNSKGIYNGNFGKKHPGLNKGRFAGKKCHLYIHGKGYESYPIEFKESLKYSIRIRDSFTCQNEKCNLTEEEHMIIYGKKLDIHHIDYNKQNCKEENLISLCRKCNNLVNKNRIKWIKYFKKIIGEKYARCS